MDKLHVMLSELLDIVKGTKKSEGSSGIKKRKLEPEAEDDTDEQKLSKEPNDAQDDPIDDEEAEQDVPEDNEKSEDENPSETEDEKSEDEESKKKQEEQAEQIRLMKIAAKAVVKEQQKLRKLKAKKRAEKLMRKNTSGSTSKPRPIVKQEKKDETKTRKRKDHSRGTPDDSTLRTKRMR